MNIAIGQIEIEPGVPFQNLERALEAVEVAKKEGAKLIVFPEMALPGYLLGDMWERASFVRETIAAQNELVRASKDIAIVFGGLATDENKINEDGRLRKYNALFVAYQGNLVPGEGDSPYPFSIKTLMPNYREFDDSRHFYDNRKLALEMGVSIESLITPHVLEIDGVTWRIGGLLCEDGWCDDYSLSPAKILAKKNINLICNLSCSPFTLGKENKRERVFGSLANDLSLPMVYCNCTGLQNNGKTVYTFDGDSTVYNANGQCQFTIAPFESETKFVQLEQLDQNVSISEDSETEKIYKGLIYGTKKFMQQTGLQKIVIGLSGGIDSALAACIYREILEPEQLLLVNMPSRFNTDLTKSAAAQLANNLGAYYTVASIQTSVDHTIEQLKGLELQIPGKEETSKLSVSDFVSENIQARDRSGRLLAGIAACFGGAFTCNANKSETTIGYSTLYGDHAGFFANLADLWKIQVYDVARYINKIKGCEWVPQSIIDIKPTAELSDKQNPEKGEGDPLHYPYHDALFKSWVESWRRGSPEELALALLEGRLEKELQIEEGIVQQVFTSPEECLNDFERWWKLYCGLGLAKRIQAPPVLAFSRRAFGFDHREAQTKVLFTQEYLKLKEKVIALKSF